MAPSSPWTSVNLDALRQAVGAGKTGTDTLAAPPSNPEDLPNRRTLPLGEVAAENIQVQEDAGLISLMVRDAPLRQVIALVAETQKLNIVFASPAEVPVTASFDRMPWQQVMEALLSISGHTWHMNEGIIYVTNIEAADYVSPQAGGRVVEVFELDFAAAVDVDNTVKGLLSPAGNSWLVETSSDDNRRTREVVAVFDYPANVARISDYICQMDQPPRQVLIEANILQVTLNDDCRSGVNFEQITSFYNNQVGFGFLSGGFTNPSGSANAAPTNSTSFISVDGTALNGFVQILQTTLDAKTLASPKILSVSGQESSIQIGDQLGYSQVTTNVNQTTQQNIQFLDTGVILRVVPRITRDGRVLMRVKPEVSKGQVNAETQTPSKQTANVDSSILLSDGQGMVIGGLIQEEDTLSESKLPWFGDLPYVGILFQNRQVVKKRTEIIVTLVPHVQPYNPIIDSRESNDYMKAAHDRLLTGPLVRVPRPYEAQLYDTFRNPRRPIATIHAAHHEVPMVSMVPMPLPPVEETWDCPTELDSEEIAFPNQPLPEIDYQY
ncbi:type II secretion system protein GspD [Bythopirellula polymerisocia]|uniref:type II secretion system protein GspD n=1 Tax=Bythopirellula polymerisocia TaxID=2528003 RepID=UPI0018D2D85D|nr:hypothetical protein [Bythopirellula polymerisocia]